MRLWRRVYQERRAVVLPLVVLLAVNAGVLALGVFPLAADVKSLQNEAHDSSIALLRARLADKQAREASASKERADVELHKFYGEILPTNATGARRVISFLERAAGEAGLAFQHLQMEESDVKDSRLVRMSGKVTLAGEYANFRKFLYHVETAQEFVVVERVGLAQASDSRAGDAGRLEVTLDVETYYVTVASPSRPQ